MSGAEKRGGFEPEIVILYCQNCAAPGLEFPSGGQPGGGFIAKFVAMPCSSKVEPSHLMKLLERGADGVEVVGCPDRQCRFLLGNVRAEKRITRLQDFLAQIRLGAERLGMDRGNQLSSENLFALARKRAEAVQGLGANPMKGVKG